MVEIRLHGRGGQGVVTAAELLAIAAWEDGIYSQAFPTFGSERMGAPVAAFVRLNKDGAIQVRSQIYNPDHLIVQDPTLIGVVDIFQGLKPGGIILINSDRVPENAPDLGKFKVITAPATDIALKILGRPIPNTTLLGAFAAATGLVSLEGINKAIMERFPVALQKMNLEAAQTTYTMIKEGNYAKLSS